MVTEKRNSSCSGHNNFNVNVLYRLNQPIIWLLTQENFNPEALNKRFD